MSFDDSINNAALALNAAAEAYHAKIAQIDDRVNAAVGSIPGAMGVQYYVDQLAGNDANVGNSAATAIKTVTEAALRGVPGSHMTVSIVGDYLWDVRPIFNVGHVRFRTAPGSPTAKITFAGAVATDATSTPGMHSSIGDMSLDFLGVNIEFSVLPATVAAHKSEVITRQGLLSVRLATVNITRAVGADQNFIGLVGGTQLHVTGGSYPVEMAGHWFGNISAGADPDTLEAIVYTNLATV
jgi:hypothetical protein